MVKKKTKPLSKLLTLALMILVMLALLSFSAFSLSDEADEVIGLKYDDFYSDFQSIEILDPGEAESFKVGFGVPEGTKDDCVIAVEDGVLHAVGIGTAKVELDGKKYTVKVEPASISMFLLIGQSNMYGNEGDESQSVANEKGTVYSTVGQSDVINADNAPQFVPSALSGQGATVNTVGTTENLENNPVNRLTGAGEGKIGLDSGLAYKWHKLTGDKVWIINASRGATTINKWLKGSDTYNRVEAVFKSAQQVMKNEILAGHYILQSYGYFWLQGCTDRANTAEYYVENFLSMHEELKKDLMFDIDGDGEEETLNFCNIIMTRRGRDDCITYRSGINGDKTDKSYFESFSDLEMSGPRVAQYWLANNPVYEDINLVCNIGDSWVYMPDGSDGVEEYFASEYENGKVDYPVQVQQSEEWYSPKTPMDVHDSIHYNQIGYNEIGFEAAENTAYLLSRADKPDNIETKVTFYDWTGYKEVSSIDALSWADSETLVVPVVYPVYESKNVTYELSDNLEYEYYDLTAKYGTEGGTLSSVGADSNKIVKVNGKSQFEKGETAYYYAGTSTGLKENTEGIYSSNPLTVVESTNGRGEIESGVHKGIIYKFDNTVNLLHNKEWLVEWTGKSEGTKKQNHSIIMLSENITRKNLSMDEIKYFWHRYSASGSKFLMTLGKSKQIGNGAATENISLSVNPYELHTYRVWNEVNQDGTNTIRLSVDGVYCGEFTSETGKDFAFRYIGAKSYEVNNYSFESLKIIGKYNCEAMGHSLLYSITEQTCATKGKVVTDCIYCDYSKKTTTPKLGHDFPSKYTSDGNATYLKDGTKSKKCSRCTVKDTVADSGSKLVLSRPKTVKATADDSTVTLSWSACKDAKGYRIYMRVNGKWKALKTTGLTAYTLTGFSAGTEYTFAVRAYTKVGSTTVWASTYKKIIVSTMLEAPEIRLSSTSKGRATAEWNDVSGETGYQLWYSVSKNGKYTKISNYSENTVKAYKKELENGKTYYFKVRAYKKTDKGYVYSDFSSIKALKIK